MAKVAGSFASVVRGVSEQIPQDRNPGQMYEQVNMVSDPVRGVARRHGSIALASQTLLTWTADITDDVLKQYREYSFFMDGVEYSVLYRSQPNVANYAQLPLMMLYDKTNNAFIPVSFSSDSAMATFRQQGLNSVTTVGGVMVASGNNILPTYTQTDPYTQHSTEGAVWVRTGGYSHTYSITLRRSTDNVTFTASYTTMQSSYPNLLDTSDIAWNTTDYQKQVNDRVNAYNSAATKWLGDAYADQQPSNIAAKLAASFVAQGFANLAQIGGTIVMNVINQLTCDDHSDGTLMWATFNTITTPTKVTPIHFNGKIVQVKAEGQQDAYYLKFVSDTGTNYNTGTWIEAPAQVVQPVKCFVIGAFNADKTTFYVDLTTAGLSTLVGRTIPAFEPTQSGDIGQVGNKPYFLDHPISHVTVFADRLVVVSNGVIFMSKSGDYFNWFRSSGLTLTDDDPIELYALGQEDDVITKSVLYNKDLFLFGLRNQYTISGRSGITPASAAVATSASEHDANYARPAVGGNVLFYGRYKSVRNSTMSYAGSVAQFQLGLFEDTPETYVISPQLDKYIKGRPTELAAMVEPTTLFVRTEEYPLGVYVYSYADAPGTQQRQFDSWSRWEWHEQVGKLVGITTFDSNLLTFHIRYRTNPATGVKSVVLGCEQFSMESDAPDVPHLDSARLVAAYTQANTYTEFYQNASFAYDNTSTRYMLGGDFDTWPTWNAKYPSESAAAWGGFEYDSSIDITPPYLRDNNDRAILTGNLTVQNYQVSVVDTGGMDGYLTRGNTYNAVTTNPLRFNGRILGRANNLVGHQPITTQIVTMPVGTNNIRHRCKFQSRHWLPMCISEIEWSGQYFNNSKRV